MTYNTDLNPLLSVHNVYKSNVYIPDYQRESFSRLRLMSHSLRIETGRWSRTPRQDRVCVCDGIQVQTERHVLLECPLSEHLRGRYSMLQFVNINDLLNEDVYVRELCSFIFDVFEIFK